MGSVIQEYNKQYRLDKIEEYKNIIQKKYEEIYEKNHNK